MTPIPYPTSMSTPLLQVCGILLFAVAIAGSYVFACYIIESVSKHDLTDKNKTDEA